MIIFVSRLALFQWNKSLAVESRAFLAFRHKTRLRGLGRKDTLDNCLSGILLFRFLAALRWQGCLSRLNRLE